MAQEASTRKFRMTPIRRVGDVVVRGLTRVGLMADTYTLTTVGRKSGQPRTNPVILVEDGGRRWLVAPYGSVSWVLNARAAGRVSVQRRGRRWECGIREITDAQEAAPILKRYLALTIPPRAYFEATKDDPVEKFAAEAGRHPVFELTVLA